MNRFLALASAMIVAILLLAPAAAAADPTVRPDEHVVVNTGGDITIPAGQHADLLVVVNGHATVLGDASGVVVVNGTVTFVGSSTRGVFAMHSRVELDGQSTVNGDIQTWDATIDRAAGAVVTGKVTDFGTSFASAWSIVGVFATLAYLAFGVMALAAGFALAGLAARQVRTVESIISREPMLSVAASLVGVIVIGALGALAIVTLIGAPLGFVVLAFVLPVLLITGYLVAGIWIGDWILRRIEPGVTRERPYRASFVGLLVLGATGWIPVVSGLALLIGFGALLVSMLRVLEGDPAAGHVAGQALEAPTPS